MGFLWRWLEPRIQSLMTERLIAFHAGLIERGEIVQHPTSSGRGPKAAKSFTSGLLFGLSSASLFLAGGLPRPKAPSAGMASDWQAIGKDMSGAMRKYGR